MTDPYLGPDGVLINRLGITSAAKLSQAEADLSMVAMLRLAEQSLPGDYDLSHLQRFHRHLFGAVYPWAGDLRTVSIARSAQDVFCLPQHIEDFAAGVFRQLAAEQRLQGLPRERFVERLAHYYAEINAVHPFREGNGRTQRAFLRQLAGDAGWRLSWATLDPAINDPASAAGLRGNLRPLTEMLQPLVGPG